MFADSREITTIENKTPKDIEFSTERFHEVSKDFDRFIKDFVKEYEVDPDNLGPTWSGLRQVNIEEIKDRYIISIYANLEARDQLLSKNEPRMLEIGSYMTGLIPAMYLASKGFKSEVMDIFPVKKHFPKLSQIAEGKYDVKIHENNIKELPDSFKDSYDVVYIQSFPPLGSKYKDILAKGVSSLLKEKGMFLVNDGGGVDMFSVFPPHFTEGMGLKWRYIAKRLNIGKYEDSRIAVLRKNSELEKIIFYLRDEFGDVAWLIAKYNFVTKDPPEKHNIDIEKFTRGHIYSLILYDNKRELPEMYEEDFDFDKVREAHRLISSKINWISRGLDYLPREIRGIVEDYKVGFDNFSLYELRIPQTYMSFKHNWVSEIKDPIKKLITSKKGYQEEIAYYQKICNQTDDEWVEFMEEMERENKTL